MLLWITIASWSAKSQRCVLFQDRGLVFSFLIMCAYKFLLIKLLPK